MVIEVIAKGILSQILHRMSEWSREEATFCEKWTFSLTFSETPNLPTACLAF